MMAFFLRGSTPGLRKPQRSSLLALYVTGAYCGTLIIPVLTVRKRCKLLTRADD